MKKISFTTLACPGWDLEQIVAVAVKSGYDAIDFRGYREELDVTKSGTFQGKRLRETKMRICDAGLEVSAISSGATMATPTILDRRDSLDEMRRCAELAVELGCRMVRIFGGRIGELSDPIENAAETLLCAQKLAEETGVRFAVETHDDWTSSERLRMAFDVAGWPQDVGTLWDVHHPYRFHGEKPEHSIRQLGRKLMNTHWKDSFAEKEGGYRLCLCGDGDVPLEEIFCELERFGYEGYYTFEWEKRWHSELFEPEVAVPHFAGWIRKLESKVIKRLQKES